MNELRRIILCKICQTPHKKVLLKKGESAHCNRCGALLYRGCEGAQLRLFSLSFSALIALGIALFFPIVTITFGGLQSSATLLGAIADLYDQGYILVAFFVAMILVVYPLLLFVAAFLSGFSLLVGMSGFAKRALLVFTVASEWSMLDIFFVAILVAMVKIFEYAHIHFDLAFWAMGASVAIELYLVRFLGVELFWDTWEELHASV